ncbi:dickkopf-related protein [Lujinxingia litoralis]|uniref:dickkopf-related protein n=1 Tax=Lujinxingia litoralis TaxID=2211119 RepID=UPI0011B94549|nr:dickkopf-related protein [Lujinxingia litoralis]
MALAFSLTTACGGDGNVQEPDTDCEGDSCEEPDVGPDADECDPSVDECSDVPDTDTETGTCSSDEQCSAGRYCYDGSCVSEQFICTLLNCAGQPGVCDPEQRACVNAEICTSGNECLAGNLCVANRCEPEEDLCASCSENEECVYDRNNLSVSCVDPTIVCDADARSCDGDTLVVCNADGTQEARINCREGCDGDELRCILPEADSCADAYQVADGDSFEIDWTEFSNYYQPSQESACVPVNRLFNTSGADVSFNATVGPGEQLTVEMTSAVDYGAIYFLEECVDVVESCVDPTATDFIRGDEEFVRASAYTNETDAPINLIVIVDTGVGTLNNPATINFSIAEPLCEPDTYQCADGQREVCNAFGNAYRPLPLCNFGCGETPETCAAAPNSVCSAAVDLEAEGFTYASTIGDLAIDPAFATDTSSNIVSDQCTFVGGGSRTEALTGGTGYFSLHLEQGQRMTATLASDENMAMWIASGCPLLPAPDSEEEAVLNCQRATNATASGTEILQYVAGITGEFILVVQAESDSVSEGEFVLDVAIEDPVCDGLANGDVLGCFDAETLAICNGDFATYYTCAGGCADGACANPTGNRCVDAINLAAGESYEGDFANLSATFNAPSSCFEGNAPAGRDAVFAVELEANDILEATLVSDVFAGVYVLSNCPGTDSIGSYCVAGTLEGDGDQYVEYFAAEAGTYYVVVDAGTTATESGTFTLNLNKRQGVCAPSSQFCANDTFQICSETGDSIIESTPCPFACTPDGTQCGGPEIANGTCDNALEITAPTTISDVYGKSGAPRFFADFVLTNEASCYGGSETNGNDAVYQVTLAPTQGLTAKLNAATTSGATLYLLSTCDETLVDASCVQSDTGARAELDYISEAGGTYFLVVDHTNAALSNDGFTIEIDFFDTPCDTLSIQRCINGGSTIEICDERGNQELTECDYGCNTELNGEGETVAFCQDRLGDTCDRPIEVTGDAYTHSDSLSGYGSVYSPYNDATSASCTGWRGDGGEVVFSVPASVGDEITVSMTSQFNAALWLTRGCTNPSVATQSCQAGADEIFGAGTETFTFTAAENRTYFIMADSVEYGSTGTFEVQIDIVRATP